MKKLMAIALMLTAVLAAGAQGKWEKVHIEADELKGQEAGDVYVFTQPDMGSFVTWGFEKFQYRLTSDECQFDIQIASGIKGEFVLVGLYDDSNKLVESFKMWLDWESNWSNRFLRTRNAGTMSNPSGQKGKVKKMFKHLQSGSGYVRIVAARFDHTDFDLKILPFNL